MAQLITADTLLSICDNLASVWIDVYPIFGTSSGSAVTGTVRGTLAVMLATALNIDVYEPEIDLITPAHTTLGLGNTESALGFLGVMISALNAHCSNYGDTVDSTINDISTFLAYYSGGSGGSKFAKMVTPEFNTLYHASKGTYLSPSVVMSPAIQPTLVANTDMGEITVGGSFVAGDDVDTAFYSEVVPAFEIQTNFAGGATDATATITGLDDEGNAVTYGPTTLTGGNNPVSALSGITLTAGVTTHARQTPTISSTTGIIAGSVLTINKDLVDEEVIIVESIGSGVITAVFRKAHSSGATVDGYTTTAAGVASTGAGRRLRSVTNLALGLGTHASGKVRVVGTQDRAAV